MNSINIRGREYFPVNERVKSFRENFKDWAITTEIVSLTEETVVIKASVSNPDGLVKATGYAQEDRNASNINKTSYVENAETSAIGRALGCFGIGIDASFASADELQAALAQQEVLNKPLGSAEVSALKMACEKKGSKVEDVCAFYKKAKPEDLTFGEFNEAMKLLAKKK